MNSPASWCWGIHIGGGGEHVKEAQLALLEDPAKIELMRGIKAVFDPAGVLNPGAIVD